jgi:hypothetical protein
MVKGQPAPSSIYYKNQAWKRLGQPHCRIVELLREDEVYISKGIISKIPSFGDQGTKAKQGRPQKYTAWDKRQMLRVVATSCAQSAKAGAQGNPYTSSPGYYHHAHRDQRVLTLLVTHAVEQLLQLPLSPDLQPIKNFPKKMKNKVLANDRSYSTTAALMQALCNAIAARQDSGQYESLYYN